MIISCNVHFPKIGENQDMIMPITFFSGYCFIGRKFLSARFRRWFEIVEISGDKKEIWVEETVAPYPF